MPTKQPKWAIITNLGDRSPLDYGGYFIYRDKTGVYPEEAELLIPEEDENTYTVYRFSLDPLKVVRGHLVPKNYDRTWPHPVERYDEWFHEDLDRVASYLGSTKEELEEAFTSDEPTVRAMAYHAIGDYFGWENLDSYPERNLTRREVEDRYKDDLRQLKA